MSARPFAIVTGASTGIGLELAKLAAGDGHDLLIVADEPAIETAAAMLRRHGTEITALQADLGTEEGVEALLAAAGGRPVDVLMANAGRGLGHRFLEQDLAAIRRVVDTNITGTLHLLHRVASAMQARNAGRILITGSIAGFMPGSFQAVYNASKAFVNSFSFALRDELKDSNVTVTCLMPGPTETEFFARAGMLDTPVGEGKKDDAATVAQTGYDAMKKGEGDVVSGLMNKVQSAMANVLPAGVTARLHRGMAEPNEEQK